MGAYVAKFIFRSPLLVRDRVLSCEQLTHSILWNSSLVVPAIHLVSPALSPVLSLFQAINNLFNFSPGSDQT